MKPPFSYERNQPDDIPSITKNSVDGEAENRTDHDYTMILIVAPVCAGVALFIVGCIVIVWMRYSNRIVVV